MARFTNGYKKVNLPGSLSGQEQQKLTPAESEVLYFITEEFLTPKKVSIRRGTSTRATYKIIKNLKEKGLLNSSNIEVHKNVCTCEPVNQSIRLHGQEFHINILFKDDRYKKLMENSNLIYIDGNTIRLYRDSIEVYSNTSFFGDTAQTATADSLAYWQKFFIRLENDLKVILVKPRKQNIRIVKAHYAEMNNGLAKECNLNADRIRIYATEDNKLWFTIDNSFNLNEAETQHTQTAKSDMQDIVTPFFNDLRDNKPPTLSQLMIVINQMAAINKETAAGLNAITTLFKSQLPQEELKEKLEEREAPFYVG